MTFSVPQLRLKYRKRGYGTLLFMMVLVVFIALLMLVVNYAYLAYSQLRIGEVTDSLARTAVSELLDENLLLPAGSPDQTDDIKAANLVVNDFLARLNEISPESQQLSFNPGLPNDPNSDVSVTPGYVADLTSPVTGANFQTTGSNLHFNTLRVQANRSSTGNNPLYLLVRGMAFPQAVDVGNASYATLDSFLVGFQPTSELNTPVAPIAIQANAWESRSVVNGRVRFRGLISNDDSAESTMLLLSFNQNDVNAAGAARQILTGTTVADIDVDDPVTGAASKFLGPVLDSSGFPQLELVAEATIPAGCSQIENALNDVADSQETRRIFPIYGTAPAGSDTVKIVGFVSARVLDAYFNTDGDLIVDLEPAFVVHPTAVTAPVLRNNNNASFPVRENVYIHKLRLSR